MYWNVEASISLAASLAGRKEALPVVGSQKVPHSILHLSPISHGCGSQAVCKSGGPDSPRAK